MKLIDADALVEAFSGGEEMKSTSESIHDERFIDALRKAPAVEAEPVKHGRWEPHYMVPGFVMCSACRDCITYDEWPDGQKWKYCPNCGAHMENGGQHGDN